MADRYWVGGSGTWDTTSTTNWSTLSGGSGGASVPTASDSVFFDQAGTYTVTMTGALTCLDITVSAGTVTFATGTSPTLAVSGSMSLIAGTVWSSTGTITFNATTTGKTISTNGTTISASITTDGVGGEWSLVGALTLTGTLTITNGSFDAVTYNVTAAGMSSNNSNVRTIAIGSGTWTLTGTAAWSTSSITNLTVSGTGTLSGTSASAKNFSFYGNQSAGLNLPNVTINQGGAGQLNFNGTNTFKNLTNSYSSIGATSINLGGGTQTFSQFTASGAPGNLLTFASAGSTLAFSGSGIVSIDYISVSVNVTFSPGPATNGTTPYVWYLGANSSKTGAGFNSTGALFQAPGIKVYQITNTATTSWTVPNDWNSSSNVIHLYGGGGGGATGVVLTSGTLAKAGGGGGGGGGYTPITNYSASPGSSITVAAGAAGVANTDGGDTSWASGTYVAGGGKKGIATSAPSSSGGAGGSGTYTGGTGGVGVTGTTSGSYSSGGGGGSAGPNGNGGNGGNAYFGGSTSAGGGGGGNGGGTSGSNGTSTAGGNGGNNSSGTGGGAGGTSTGTAGTNGGGGSGGRGFGQAGAGGASVEILNSIGGSGGKGGMASATPTANVGFGGGGCGGGALSTGTAFTGGSGAPGIIIIAYTPVSTGSTSNFLSLFFRR